MFCKMSSSISCPWQLRLVHIIHELPVHIRIRKIYSVNTEQPYICNLSCKQNENRIKKSSICFNIIFFQRLFLNSILA